MDYCQQIDFKRSLSRIWENDKESDCRYSEDDYEDDQAYGANSSYKQADDVSSESSLDDDFPVHDAH